MVTLLVTLHNCPSIEESYYYSQVKLLHIFPELTIYIFKTILLILSAIHNLK